jgi:hypothetical protein
MHYGGWDLDRHVQHLLGLKDMDVSAGKMTSLHFDEALENQLADSFFVNLMAGR